MEQGNEVLMEVRYKTWERELDGREGPLVGIFVPINARRQRAESLPENGSHDDNLRLQFE